MDTTELQNQATEIRDAENEGENTATKVGTLLVNIIQALAGTVTEESLTETLAAVEEELQRDYASLENGTVKWHQRGVIMLKSMGSALDNIDGGSYTPTIEIGDTWFSPTSGGLKHRTQDGDEAWSVRPDAVYINSHTLRVYKWASGSMVELGSERNPVMIDYMVSKTLDSIAVGEVFWQSSNNKLVVKTGASSVRMYSPDPSVIYCARDTKSLMFWDATTSTWQSVGGGSTSGLTKVISNIELVNSKVNALINALANIAFKQLPKPEMTELDWGGAKHTVTINNTLSGCSADKSGTQQVSEGSALVVTITADSGKLLRSVSASSGTVVIAANKTTATVTLTVNDDMTLTVQASATAAGSFTASISDNRVSGTGATSGITEGSSWTSVLSLNSDDPSDEITNVTVEMAGGGSDSISAEKVNGEWTVQTGYVTGNITITVTVSVVAKHTVSLVNSNTNDGDAVLKMFSDSAKTSEISNPRINDGGSFTCYLGTSSADVDIAWGLTDGEAWPYPVRVVMGSQDITQAAFDKGAMKVEIPQVTDNIVITAQTMTWTSSRSVNSNGSLGADTNYSATDYIDLSGVSKLVLHHQTYAGANKSAAFYDSEKTYVEGAYYSMNANYRTCQIQEGRSYTRITCATSRRKSFFVRAEKNGDWVYLYRGIDYDGRNEDEYNVEYGAGLTKSGGSASITLPAVHVLTDFIEVGDYDTLYFNIGQNIDAYNANTYDSNKTRISGFTQGSSVPREVDNASKSIKYIRMTSNIFDGAYVYGKKTVDGVDVYEWIMRGIAVSDSTLPSGNGTTE